VKHRVCLSYLGYFATVCIATMTGYTVRAVADHIGFL
jgi:hypothetical protein